MNMHLCGGHCKHGVCEASRCDECWAEMKAAGFEPVLHEGNKGDLRDALAGIFGIEQPSSIPVKSVFDCQDEGG